MSVSRRNLLQCELPFRIDSFRDEIDVLFSDLNPGLQELGAYLSAELWRKLFDHVVRAGVATSYQEATGFLNQTIDVEPRMIGVTDFKGGPTRIVKRLEDMFGIESGVKPQRVAVEIEMRLAGSVTHLLFLWFSGGVSLSACQGSLFPRAHSSGESNQFTADIGTRQRVVFRRAGRVPAELLKEIENNWTELIALVSPFGLWADNYVLAMSLLQRMQELLGQVFGPYPYLLPFSGDPEGRYFLTFVLLTWARYILDTTHTLYAFLNLPPAGPRLGLASGRTDELQIVGARREEWVELGKRMRGSERPSVSLVHDLLSNISRKAVPQINDLKVRIGDWGLNDVWGEGKFGMDTFVDLSPLPPTRRFEEQGLRYAVFSFLDRLLLRGERPRLPESFEELTYVYLVSLAPMGQELFSIDLSPERCREFLERYARRRHHAERNARIRVTGNAVLSFLEKLNGSGKKMFLGKSQTEFPFSRSSPGTLFLDSLRRFTGKGEVLEIVGEAKDGPRYVFHLARAISQRMVGEKHLAGKALFVCPWSEHEDSTPSASIYGGKIVHCFGCHRRAQLSYDEISLDRSSLRVLTVKKTESQYRQTLRQELPPARFLEIMEKAQSYLHSAFPASKAAIYIERRGIYYSEAREFGAGHGNTAPFLKMIREGHATTEELEQYGLIWRRGKTRFGSILNDRFTVPLYVRYGDEWRLTNFYGRRLWFGPREKESKEHRHHKVDTGFPQGAFNPQVLEDPELKRVVLTESVIDALSLIQIDFVCIAIVGTENHLILEQVAHALADRDVTVSIGLNDDKSGREKTPAVAERLEMAGLPRDRIDQDFTQRFMARYRDEWGAKLNLGPEELEEITDFNAWCLRFPPGFWVTVVDVNI